MRISEGLRASSLAVKIFSAMGFLALTAALVGICGVYTARVYSAKVAAMQGASRRAILGEQVNGLINAIVMDSRGIYLAKTPSQVEKFAKPLTENLRLVDQRMGEWSGLVADDGQAMFEACVSAVRNFIVLRNAIVDAGRAQGGGAADALGNNDAARTNREAVNRAVVALAARNAAEIDRVAEELAQFHEVLVRVVPAITAAAIVIVAILVILLVHRGITGPLGRVTMAIRQVAKGDLDIVVPARGHSDEIGAIAGALETFRLQAIAKREMTEARIIEQSAAEADKRAALREMAASIERTAISAMTEIKKRNDGTTLAVEEMMGLAESTGVSARGATEAASIAASIAETIADAAGELTVSIQDIDREVNQSSRIITRAVAASGTSRVAIDGLTQTVDRIGAVADIIAAIAGRTNLLALNATIEAARVGDAGKGFAVVASEVKQLANQTARSTEEIGNQIREVRAATLAVAEAVSQIEAAIRDVDDVSGAITSAIRQQNSATAKIAQGIGRTAEAIGEMRGRNAKVSADAERSGVHAHRVLDNANDLGKALESLKLAVVRAVRESTDEVNRRASERVDVALRGWVDSDGATPHVCRITNLSVSGARLDCDPDTVAEASCRLRIDGLNPALAFTIVERSGSTVRISFDDDLVARAAVHPFLESLRTDKAA